MQSGWMSRSAQMTSESLTLSAFEEPAVTINLSGQGRLKGEAIEKYVLSDRVTINLSGQGRLKAAMDYLKNKKGEVTINLSGQGRLKVEHFPYEESLRVRHNQSFWTGEVERKVDFHQGLN